MTPGRLIMASVIAMRSVAGEEQGVDLLLDPGRGAGAQYPAAEDGLFQFQEGGLDLPPVVVEPDDLGGGTVGIEDGRSRA